MPGALPTHNRARPSQTSQRRSPSTPSEATYFASLIGREVTLSAERIQAVLTGIGIGDALGLPVETKSAAEIATDHGRIDRYLSPRLNVHFRETNYEPGTTSDDLQLTLAVLNAIIEARGYDPTTMVIAHANALAECSLGWGGSTRSGVELALEHGMRWYEKVSPAACGIGNGVPMKITGLALLSAICPQIRPDTFARIAEFAMMTHPTSIGVASGAAHAAALLYCLSCTPSTFRREEFARVVCAATEESVANVTPISGGEQPGHTASDLLRELSSATDGLLRTSAEIIDRFRGGCQVVESLPLSYALFLKDPTNFSCVIDAVNAGGDTDSNAALVGGLFGALNGLNAFPVELKQGLREAEKIQCTARKFWSVAPSLS